MDDVLLVDLQAVALAGELDAQERGGDGASGPPAASQLDATKDLIAELRDATANADRHLPVH